MEHRFRLRALALAIGSTLILAACGGSGGGHNESLGGVASEGIAIANATLTVKDASGNVRTTTTDAAGNYTLDTSGPTPLIKKKYIVLKNDYIHHMLDVYHI